MTKFDEATAIADVQRDHNGVKVTAKVYVGAVHVPAGTKYTRRYETAAWYTEYETVEDGWYPVFARPHHLYGDVEWVASATVPVVCTSEYTPSLFGGVAVGSQPQGKQHRNVGSESTWQHPVKPGAVEDGTFLPVTLGLSAVTNYYQMLRSVARPDEGVRIHTSRTWRPYNAASMKKRMAEAVEAAREEVAVNR